MPFYPTFLHSLDVILKNTGDVRQKFISFISQVSVIEDIVAEGSVDGAAGRVLGAGVGPQHRGHLLPRRGVQLQRGADRGGVDTVHQQQLQSVYNA